MISLSLILACRFPKMFYIWTGNLLLKLSAKHLHSADEQLHSMVGSFGYVAPEVLLKQGHGKPVDIWSTGYSIFSFSGWYVFLINIRSESLPMFFFADTHLSVLMISSYSSRKQQQLKLNFRIDIGRMYHQKVLFLMFIDFMALLNPTPQQKNSFARF